MNELLRFLLQYGYWLTLGSVFLEQLGLPLPAVPILVGMGALARSGDFWFPAILLAAVSGSLVADLIWLAVLCCHEKAIPSAAEARLDLKYHLTGLLLHG